MRVFKLRLGLMNMFSSGIMNMEYFAEIELNEWPIMVAVFLFFWDAITLLLYFVLSMFKSFMSGNLDKIWRLP